MSDEKFLITELLTPHRYFPVKEFLNPPPPSKKKWGTKQHGTRGGTIGDRRTKTFVQVRGHEPRSIAFRIGVVEAGCLGSPRLPALGGKKREISEMGRWQTHGGGAGQGALSESAPNWSGSALSTPPTSKRSQTESNKKWFGKGLVRENQKRKACPFFF